MSSLPWESPGVGPRFVRARAGPDAALFVEGELVEEEFTLRVPEFFLDAGLECVGALRVGHGPFVVAEERCGAGQRRQVRPQVAVERGPEPLASAELVVGEP